MRHHLIIRLAIQILLVLLVPFLACAGPWYFPPVGDKHWVDTYGEISTSLVFGDINGDGKNEIVFGTKKGYIVAINSNGKKPHAIKIGESIKADPILLDLRKSGTPDILAFAKLSDYDKPAEKSIVAVIDGRSFTKRTEVTIPGGIVSRPAIADFDNDGNVDILVAARGLFIIDGAGLAKNAPLDVYQFDVNGTIFSSPVVEDLNDDGINDFIIPFTYKDKYYLQVFLSTANDFVFDQVTLPISNELRVAPTLIKGGESKDAITWRLVCPTHNKTVDFYTLTVGTGKTLSIKQDLIYQGLQYSFMNQLPAFCGSGSDCFLYLNIIETNSIWKINAVTGAKFPVPDEISPYDSIPFYIGKSDNGTYVPMILSQDNNTLYRIEDGRKDKLAEFSSPIPQLDKLYLFPTSGAQYALTGITGGNQIYFVPAPVIKLSLHSPNVPDYFNQGVLPPPEMEYLLTELKNSLASHNDDRADVLMSIAGELYPGDQLFRQTIRTFKQEIKQEAALLSSLTAVKRDIMEMVSQYDYPALLQFVIYRDAEKKLDYVLIQDPEFLEEPGVAAFYGKVKVVRSVINAFIPLATGIFILTAIVLVVFNYPLFLKIFYWLFFRWRERSKWKKIISAHPAQGEVTAYLDKAGLLISPPTQAWDFSLKILLAKMIKRGTMEWLEILRLYETNVTGSGNLSDPEKRRFYRYLLNLYKRMFYLRLARVSLFDWLIFQTKHVFQRDYYDIQTNDKTLCALKFELAREFLNLNEFKPAFNYLHKFILKKYEGGSKEEMDFLDRLPDHKIENYFLNFDRHFFSRVPELKDQIGILTAYRGKQLQDRVDQIINTRLKDCLQRRGFPMVVVADYALMGLFRDHGMFISLSAYNQAKKTDTVLRCIPVMHNHINIADDTGFNTLPDGFTRIQNVHRSQKWVVQVEPLIKVPSLRTLCRTGMVPHKARDILTAITALLSTARPLRFIPNLHPSHVFWNGGKVLLAGNGLSKLHIDREIILNYRKYKTSFEADGFVTPEFCREPSPEKTLGSEEAIEKTIVYYLGLLAYWMLEGRPPFSGVPPESGTPVSLTKFSEAERLINAALAPVQKRIRIYEFKDIMQDIRWGWDKV
ncbi:MAG: VCBS repeat-containing protein [Nitrospirae bacterium]|nr:VCBS repeat-containing protein [Nitrospirota bacterium]